MSIFSLEGAFEGWLHYSPQDQTNFSSEGLTNLHFFAGDARVQCCSRIISGEFHFSKSVLYIDHVGACLNCQFIVHFALY